MLSFILNMVKEVLEKHHGKKEDSSFIVLIFAILCVGIVLSFNYLNAEIEDNRKLVSGKLETIEKNVTEIKTYLEILKDREHRQARQ